MLSGVVSFSKPFAAGKVVDIMCPEKKSFSGCILQRTHVHVGPWRTSKAGPSGLRIETVGPTRGFPVWDSSFSSAAPVA